MTKVVAWVLYLCIVFAVAIPATSLAANPMQRPTQHNAYKTRERYLKNQKKQQKNFQKAQRKAQKKLKTSHH
jgi:hypothetical protein